MAARIPSVREAARLLGGEVFGADQVLCPGPGHSRKDRSLAVWIGSGRDGFTTHSHAGDPLEVCRDHVRVRLGLDPYAPRAERRGAPPPLVERKRDTSDRARSLWRSAVNPKGTPVERYLDSRCLPSLPASVAGRAVRWSSHRSGVDGAVGCMMSLFREIRSDLPVGVHRTFLDRQGRKLTRKMLGVAGRAAVKLTADEDISMSVTLAEGVETGLAALALGYSNVWALGSAGAIQEFPILPGLEAITVLAEREDDGRLNRASEKAITALAARCNAECVEIFAVDAPNGGDANDVLARRVGRAA